MSHDNKSVNERFVIYFCQLYFCCPNCKLLRLYVIPNVTKLSIAVRYVYRILQLRVLVCSEAAMYMLLNTAV